MTCRPTKWTKLNHFPMVSKISSTHFSDNHAFSFLQMYLDNILFFASFNADDIPSVSSEWTVFLFPPDHFLFFFFLYPDLKTIILFSYPNIEIVIYFFYPEVDTILLFCCLQEIFIWSFLLSTEEETAMDNLLKFLPK